MIKNLRERNILFSEEESEKRIKRFHSAILRKYPKVRTYTGKTYSDNPFVNHKVVAMYLTSCKDLKLDPFDLLPFESFNENRKENILENRLLAMYCSLNREGRKRIMEMFEDICSIDKYRKI